MYTQKYKELTISATSYNRKVSIELPCDSELSEVVDAFEALMVGLGYSLDSWKDEIMERGEVFKMQELRNQKDMEFYIDRNTKLEDELMQYKMQDATNRLAMEA
jgi:hypothetical protein